MQTCDKNPIVMFSHKVTNQATQKTFTLLLFFIYHLNETLKIFVNSH